MTRDEQRGKSRAARKRFSLTEVGHQPPQVLAALLEIGVLVIAGARRRQKDDVARLRLGCCELDGMGDRARARVRTPGSIERWGELVGRFAHEVYRLHVLRQLARERSEVLALGPPAEDEPQRR